MIGSKLLFNLRLEFFFIALLPVSIVLGNFILNLNIFFIIVLYLYNNYQNINILKNLRSYNYFLLFLILFLIFNAAYSADFKLTLKGQLGFVKHLILYLSLCYFFVKNDQTFKVFINILLLVILLTLFDTFWQFIFKKDLFGYYLIESHGNRLSGPFGDEYIVGGFILKTIFFTRNHKLLNKNYNWVFYIIISYIIVILASQRMPTIMFSFSLIFLFFLDKRFNFKLIIITSIIAFLGILIIFNITPKIKKHYLDRTFEQIGVYQKGNINNFWDSQWGAHYLTSIEIFKDSKLLGAGIKNFRVACQKESYSNIKSSKSMVRCATHPHNIYFEILAETGLIGIIIFSFLMLNFIRSTKVLNWKLLRRNPEILILFFIFFWPVQSTGSLFSTWNGFFYPLFFSYVYYISKKFNEENLID